MTSAAQTWTLLAVLGVFATMSMTMVLFSFTSLRNEMRAGFEAVDTRFDAVGTRFDAVGIRFDAVGTRFDGVDKRLDGVDRRLDNLDRDVQALSDRVFRDRP